jgi:hypothetical protein
MQWIDFGAREIEAAANAFLLFIQLGLVAA